MFRENIINSLIIALLLGAALTAYLMAEGYYVNLISRIIIFSIAGVGLNFALGYGGMVSLGHAAFFGLGAYVAGIAAFHFGEESQFLFGLNGTNQMPMIWLISILVSAFFALIIGIISLRTTGVYFIMITLAFAQMIYYFAISWPNYGGEDGLLILARNQFSFNEINNGVNNGISIDTDNELIFFLICFILLIFILFISARMLHSRFGNALEVARMNDVRLATAGINPFPIKLTAFVFSAMIVGLSGALFADLNRFVSPSLMSWQMSGEIIIFILLGGVGRLFGPVLGATLFVLLETFIGGYTEHWKLFLGLVLLAIVLFGKGGLMQLLAGDKHHV